MKKSPVHLYLFTILMTFQLSLAQKLAFYDAQFIYDSCYNVTDGLFINKGDLYSVLKDYFPHDKLSEDLLRSNPFFNPLIPVSISQSKDMSSISRTIMASKGIINTLDVTTISQGLSLFMIERTKQELNIAFFEKLKNYFNKNEEIWKIFPTTTKILENMVSYRYPEILPMLRTAFYKDLKNWPVNLDDALSLPKYATLIDSFPQLQLLTKTFIIMSSFQSGEIDAAGIINHFALLDNIWYANDTIQPLVNTGNAFKFANVISESLLDTAQYGGWIDASKLKTIVSNPILFRIYLGLLYQMVINSTLL